MSAVRPLSFPFLLLAGAIATCPSCVHPYACDDDAVWQLDIAVESTALQAPAIVTATGGPALELVEGCEWEPTSPQDVQTWEWFVDQTLTGEGQAAQLLIERDGRTTVSLRAQAGDILASTSTSIRLGEESCPEFGSPELLGPLPSASSMTWSGGHLFALVDHSLLRLHPKSGTVDATWELPPVRNEMVAWKLLSTTSTGLLLVAETSTVGELAWVWLLDPTPDASLVVASTEIAEFPDYAPLNAAAVISASRPEEREWHRAWLMARAHPKPFVLQLPGTAAPQRPLREHSQPHSGPQPLLGASSSAGMDLLALRGETFVQILRRPERQDIPAVLETADCSWPLPEGRLVALAHDRSALYTLDAADNLLRLSWMSP